MVVVTEKVPEVEPEDSNPEQIKKHVNEKKWGYDLYPERKGGKYSPGMWKILSGDGGSNITIPLTQSFKRYIDFGWSLLLYRSRDYRQSEV